MYARWRQRLPDSNQENQIAALQEKVRLLTDALHRERNAKLRLEALQSEKQDQVFRDNKALLHSFDKAKRRQEQLEFLTELTRELFTSSHIEDITRNFAANLSRLFQDCPTWKINIPQKSTPYIEHFQHNDKQWKELSWQPSFQSFVNSCSQFPVGKWHRLELTAEDIQQKAAFLQNKTVVFLLLDYAVNNKLLVLLDLPHFCFSDDVKQTMNIAASQVNSAIGRKATEVELSYNYQKLKQANEELQSTQRQLLHNEKMASLGQLAAGVAHEINNPTSYVTSNLQTLKDYLKLYELALGSKEKLTLDSKQEKALAFAREDTPGLLEACVEGLERITEIVASLKTFSRKEEDHFIATDLNQVVEDSLKIVWNEIKYLDAIVQDLSSELPSILGNAGQLQQVIVNLLVNAAQSISENGKLIVSTYVENEDVTLSVTDNGSGMDKKVLEKIFEPFYTTKKENEGTGLGLSVSYAIVKKHGGLISVNSSPNIGTTFTLRFPALLRT